MFGLSIGEIALIFLVALFFLGPKKLPELAKGMGKGIRDFQKALKGEYDDASQDSSAEEKKSLLKKSEESVQENSNKS